MRFALVLAILLCGCAAGAGRESAGAAFADDLDAGPDAAAPDAAPAPLPAPAPQPACYDRCVRGVVTARDGTPAAGIPVLLEDERTLQIRSYVTTAAGEYRFVRLSPDDDYELSARGPDDSSASASVSRFDDRDEIVIDLRLR